MARELPRTRLDCAPCLRMPRTPRATRQRASNAARAMPNAAEMAPSSFLQPEARRSAQTLQSNESLTLPSHNRKYRTFFHRFLLMKFRQWWFPDPRHASGLTENGLSKQEAGLVFVRRRNSNINLPAESVKTYV